MIEQVGPEARLRDVGEGVNALGRLARDLPQLLKNAEIVSAMLAQGGMRLHPDTIRADRRSPGRPHAPRPRCDLARGGGAGLLAWGLF